METNKVWERVFRPKCFGIEYDGRTLKCFHCKDNEECGHNWIVYWHRNWKWIKRLEKQTKSIENSSALE